MTDVLGGRIEVPEAELSVPGGLPDPLVCTDGRPVPTPADWVERRRPELLELFERHMFGRTPRERVEVRSELVTSDPGALDGRATRAEVRLSFGPPGGPAMTLLVYLPN